MQVSDQPNLLLLNTIGLTNVELLLSVLSKYKEILALPGQNFSVFENNLYRPHNYSNLSSSEIFNTLSRNLYTKSGRIWMGLTKNMNEIQKNNYSKDNHRKIFLSKSNSDKDFTNNIKLYITSYYESCNIDTKNSKYAAWFSNNVLLCHKHYPDFQKTVKVIHVSSEISRWLSTISSTRTWNCINAIKFWILNNLYAINYINKNPGNIAIYSNNLIDNPENAIKEIESFLGISPSNKREDCDRNGFININKELLETQKQVSLNITNIYRGNMWFELANSFEEWNLKFLENEKIQTLLDDFSDFWNTTSHTNLDWIGPVGDEIMDHLIKFRKISETTNMSFDFYHKFFSLNSDDYELVQSNLQHSLGCLEDKIEIPPLPYFIRICIFYIISCTKNSIKHGHSYISPKNGSIYKRINSLEFKGKIKIFGLLEMFNEMEDLINKADLIFSKKKD